MRVIIVDDAPAASRIVATIIDELLGTGSEPVLGVAAGRTPRGAYELLVAQRPPIDRASVVMLDEYLGVGPGQPTSFRHQIREQLTDRLGIEPSRVHSLDGTTSDPMGECQRFEATIAGLGGVDLQVLGLGRNGHIGFNEPGSGRDSRTRLVRLSETTRADNASAFGDGEAVPLHALTQGIGTILEARRIVLLVTGASKAAAVLATLDGPVTEAIPASALQLHGDATAVLDRAAAARLSHG